MNKLKLFILLLSFAFSVKAQDASMVGDSSHNTSVSYNDHRTDNLLSKEIVPVLKGKRYTYKDGGDDVLVVFTEHTHIEYFDNKKYSMESSIVWTADNECYMTLQKSNLPNSSFKRGDVFYLKINKIKQGYVYYQSTANTRSWRGRMKRLEI
jgi:hypothetical protein